MDQIARKAKNFLTATGKVPFREWLNAVDGEGRARINARIRRIEELGNYGECEPVGAGVFELKIYAGPGYRVYFGIDGNLVILLGGGDKSSQPKDIKKAKTCWREYNA